MAATAAQVGAFPLSLAQIGERVRVVAFSAGRGVERKLTDMGLPIGSEFTIIARQPGGPVVIAREGMRLALGSGIGHRVMVSRAHGP